MLRCKNCNKLIFLPPLKDGDDKFCSLKCYTASETGTFCKKCLSNTTDESPGDTISFNGFGKTFLSSKDRCPDCHSIMRTQFFCILFIPVVVLGKYRLIYDKKRSGRYYGRRVDNKEEILKQEGRKKIFIKIVVVIAILLIFVGYFKGWHYDAIAGFHHAFGNKNKAIEHYMSKLEKDPDNYILAKDIAACYSMMNEKEKAIFWLKKAITLSKSKNVNKLTLDNEFKNIINTPEFRELFD